jgi:hypothetical protein
MAVQKAKDYIGIARQWALGSVALTPQFGHGLAGGGIKVDVNQEPDPLTSAYLARAAAYRDKAEAGAEYTARAWEKSVGLYLLAALGSISTAGGGDPYTHTITLGTSVPYLTVFEKKGDDTVLAVADCKVDELAFSWEENSPVELGVKLVGTDLSFPATFVADVNEVDTRTYFAPVGGTFKIDVDGETPATAALTAGSIAIKRSAEAEFYSGDIEAGDVHESFCEVEVNFTVVPTNLNEWRALVTGTTNGTAVANTPTYGSFEMTFAYGTHTLKFSALEVAFMCDLPEADPGGGAADVELSGQCYLASGTPITVTLTNGQSSYAADLADS